MTVEVMERNRIVELAETEEIKELRKQNQEFNEMAYADRDILSFASILSGICGLNVYSGKEAIRYFEILDARDFLSKKFTELSVVEMEEHKDEIEEYLEEANEELDFLKTQILNPKPILQWFQDAQALNPNIKIPSFLEKKEHITHKGILTAVNEENGQAFITLENMYGSRKQEFQYEISPEAATAFRAFIGREIEILIENGHVKNAITLIWNQSTNEA